MKAIVGILAILIITSCSDTKIEREQETITKRAIKPTDSSLIKSNLGNSRKIADTGSEELEEEPCIFDQATQTDAFLTNVEELKSYKWDQEKRTATFILESGDTLQIFRGGCVHFSVQAEFKFRNDKTDFKNWNNVYKKALWIAELLEHEFHYEQLKEDIEGRRVDFEKYDENIDIATFRTEILVDNDYSISRIYAPGLTRIVLSYTII